MYRHGDLLIVPTAELPLNVKPVPRKGDLILAEGTVTGHAHRIATKTVQMWEAGEQRYISVTDEAALTHEEHHTITLPPGIYQVVQQRVYTPEGIQRVVD